MAGRQTCTRAGQSCIRPRSRGLPRVVTRGSVEQQAYKAPFNSPGNRDKNLPATLLSAADRKMSWLRSAIWNLFLLDMRRLAMVS